MSNSWQVRLSSLINFNTTVTRVAASVQQNPRVPSFHKTAAAWIIGFMDVLIVGAGGHGRVVLDILRAAGKHRVVGFLDADPALTGTRVHDVEVLGAMNVLPKLRGKAKAAIVAVGDNAARGQLANKLTDAGLELISAVHPTAAVSPTAKVGLNVVIAAGAVVSADALIADSVILNTGCIVDHECVVGTAAHICPAAALAGRVNIGEQAFVGLGARVIQCLTIGAKAVVGAGAVIIRDVPPGATVVGVPGRVLGIS